MVCLIIITKKDGLFDKKNLHVVVQEVVVEVVVVVGVKLHVYMFKSTFRTVFIHIII